MQLSCHRGFPCLTNVKCPIFLQDKFAYIAIMSNYFIPSMKIRLHESSDMQEKYLNSEDFKTTLARSVNCFSTLSNLPKVTRVDSYLCTVDLLVNVHTFKTQMDG
jgi:hypothetical protein